MVASASTRGKAPSVVTSRSAPIVPAADSAPSSPLIVVVDKKKSKNKKKKASKKSIAESELATVTTEESGSSTEDEHVAPPIVSDESDEDTFTSQPSSSSSSSSVAGKFVFRPRTPPSSSPMSPSSPMSTRSTSSSAHHHAAAFSPPVYTLSQHKSTYPSHLYPASTPGLNVHPKLPFFTALSTYFAYGILIVVGHIRDFLNRLGYIRTVKSSPHYSTADADAASTGAAPLAPLVSDFDDFFTRRLYHRIEEAWNRPIASCPASIMKLVVRDRQGYGTPLELTGETKSVLNLGSYNYLGFGDPNSPTKPAVLAALEQFGVSTTSSRVALGTTVLHQRLENIVAHFVGKPAAMVFGMGFATNSTGIPALVGKGGLIISDANNHSSIACGARSGGAVIRVFKHNDVVSLEAILRHAIITGQPKSHRPWTKIMVIIEGIYSMEGEICPLPQIVALKKRYGAYLFVDEAHSIGAIGANGRGICEYAGVDPADVDILMGTFTKSFGAVGGYLAGEKQTIDWLRAHCAGAVTSSSISPPAVQQVISAFQIMLHEDGTSIGQTKLDSLRENSNYFRSKLKDMGCHVLGDWDSPIVLLMLYHPAMIYTFSSECLKRGLAVVVVGFPATPLLLARVRFCLSAGHTREQLNYALMQIEEVCDLVGAKYASKDESLNQE